MALIAAAAILDGSTALARPGWQSRMAEIDSLADAVNFSDTRGALRVDVVEWPVSLGGRAALRGVRGNGWRGTTHGLTEPSPLRA